MYSNPYFTNVPDISDLNLEEILVDDGTCPIFFTLISESGQRYISVCCDMYEDQRWIIAPISNYRLIGLLTNKVSMRNVFLNSNAFFNNRNCIVAHWSKDNPVFRYEKVPSYELPERDLPLNEMLNSKEDEFAEYILKIRKSEEPEICDRGIAQDSTELRKLLAENPDLPIVSMTRSDVLFEDCGWCYGCNVWCDIITILDCETPFRSEYVYDDKDDFREDLAEYLYELYPTKLKEMSDEDFDKLVAEEAQKYAPYWKRVIAIRADV